MLEERDILGELVVGGHEEPLTQRHQEPGGKEVVRSQERRWRPPLEAHAPDSASQLLSGSDPRPAIERQGPLESVPSHRAGVCFVFFFFFSPLVLSSSSSCDLGRLPSSDYLAI